MTMIGWAVFDPSPWALVGGTAVGAVLRTSLSHLLWGGDRFGWDRAAWLDVFHFGKWVFVSTALMFLVTQADRLIFAAMIPTTMLAVYGLGLQLAMVVPEMISKLTGGVLFSAYCRVVQTGESLPASFLRYRRPIVLLGGYGLAAVCAGSAAGIDLLAPGSYAEAWWILLLLAGGMWFSYVLQNTHGSALLATGHTRLLSRTSVAKLLGMVLLIPAGYWLHGFPGAVAAYAGTDVLRYLTMLHGVHGIGVRAGADDARLTGVFFCTAGTGFGAQWLVEQAGGGALLRCSVAGGFVTLAWTPLLVPVLRQMRELWRR
jgi:O-antigen/teichoic acid export membrane protein